MPVIIYEFDTSSSALTYLVRRYRQGVLKKETEGLILAAQDQAFRTNAINYQLQCIDISGFLPAIYSRNATAMFSKSTRVIKKWSSFVNVDFGETNE